MKDIALTHPSHIIRSHGTALPCREQLPDSIFAPYHANVSEKPLLHAFGELGTNGHGGVGRRVQAESWQEVWEKAMSAPARKGARVLYIHFPFCRHRCVFCPFYMNRNSADIQKVYIDSLLREIELSAAFAAVRDIPFEAVYLGGGTPSDFSGAQIASVLTAVRESFPLSSQCEITVEGRVSGFDVDKARAWIDAGANRFSLGVQTFDTRQRQRLGRIADKKAVLERLNELSLLPGVTMNIDLLYGLPGQTLENVVNDLRLAAQETSIHGLDLYHLKTFPGSPLAKQIEGGRLPPVGDKELKAECFTRALTELEQLGFRHITLQHWARDERERSVYNQLAKGDGDMLALGSGAGGSWAGVGFMQERDLERYLEMVEHGEKPIAFAGNNPPWKQLVNRFQLQMEQHYLEPVSIGLERFGLSSDSLTPLLEQWREAGLLEHPVGGRYALTSAGVFWHQAITQRLNSALAVVFKSIATAAAS